MKPHRDDYASAFTGRFGGPDTIASAIMWVVVALIMLQAIPAAIGWPERAGRCEPGTIYAEPGNRSGVCDEIPRPSCSKAQSTW